MVCDLWWYVVIRYPSMLSLSVRIAPLLSSGSPLWHVCGRMAAVARSKYPGPWFNIKMPSYQYRKSHCGDKTVVRSSYLHNGVSYTGKMASLYWIGPLQNMNKYITCKLAHPGRHKMVDDLQTIPVRFKCSFLNDDFVILVRLNWSLMDTNQICTTASGSF